MTSVSIPEACRMSARFKRRLELSVGFTEAWQHEPVVVPFVRSDFV